MDLYYRESDNIAKHYSAAAARLAYSMVRAIPNLPEAAWREMQRLLTVESLWALCLVLAGWLIATVLGGAVGLAVNGLLIVYGLWELWDEIKAIANDLKEWAISAYYAKSEADLETAGQHFAQALAGGGLTVLEVVVTHRAFRAIETKISTRYPPPKELQKEYERAVRQRESRIATEKKLSEQVRDAGEKAVKAAKDIASGARGEGMRRAADAFPTGAVIAAAVVGTTVVVGAAFALGGDRK